MRYLVLAILILQVLYSQAAVHNNDCFNYCSYDAQKGLCYLKQDENLENDPKNHEENSRICIECCEPEDRFRINKACVVKTILNISTCQFRSFEGKRDLPAPYPKQNTNGRKMKRRRRRRISKRRLRRNI